LTNSATISFSRRTALHELVFIHLCVTSVGNFPLAVRVFVNRLLRNTFGPNREDVAGGRRRLPNEKLHNLYVSPSIIRVINSRRMRWTGI